MIGITKKLRTLSSLNLFFWSTLWLIIVLIIGTIEQKYIGLFESQKTYFTSLYFFYKGIPLPSGGTVILIMTLGLLSQLIFRTNFKTKRTLGITITHLGAVLLLSGAMITRFFGEEGSVVIPEGSAINYMQDYKSQDFVLKNEQNAQEMILAADQISLKQEYRHAGLVFRISKNNPNCVQTTNPDEKIRCVEMDITSLKNEPKHILISGDSAEATRIQLDGQTFTAEVRPHRMPLPFSVKLLDFEKKFHQGTMLSKSFKSEVQIIDGPLTSRHVIEMNTPLRYKGYTFYQSSFSENAQGEITELSVVKNAAQWFPYLSSIIICIGLLLHLLINSKNIFKAQHE